MKFTVDNSIELLKRTPHVLQLFLHDINEQWALNNEGAETWSPFDVLGHLIHCDEYNWLPRIELILSDSSVREFIPLDRFAQMEKSKGKSLNQLLDEFVKLRFTSLEKLKALNITEQQLSKTAIHPELGSVTLSQLISTWVVHDLDHISQISRVMAKQYKAEVGPWIQYMKVLK